VTDGIFPYFVDELTKIAVQMTKKEEGKLYAQYAGLGAVSYPAIRAVANKIESGHVVSPGNSKAKWLVGSVLRGTAGGALIPALRLHLVKRMENKARDRLRHAETRKQKVP
jgi:hypothetical protein